LPKFKLEFEAFSGGQILEITREELFFSLAFPIYISKHTGTNFFLFKIPSITFYYLKKKNTLLKNVYQPVNYGLIAEK